ncbi:unnamed protein product [Lampetra fluviatilis]
MPPRPRRRGGAPRCAPHSPTPSSPTTAITTRTSPPPQPSAHATRLPATDTPDAAPTTTTSTTSSTTSKLHLQRELGLMSGASLIAGTMIGSGIFMSPGWVLRYAGSAGASLLVWLACGVLATLGALCYAELGTLMRESGGDYIYALRTYGPVPAFLFAWSSVLVVRPASIAAGALSFARYAAAPFYPECGAAGPPPLVTRSLAAACVVALTLVNCASVRLAAGLQNACTAVKVAALSAVALGGVVLLARGAAVHGLTDAFVAVSTSSVSSDVSGATDDDADAAAAAAGTAAGQPAASTSSIGLAFYQGLWSYDGWNNLNFVTEELGRPEVTLPRAILIALPMVTLLYLFVNMSYLAAMTPAEILSSSAVAWTWGARVMGAASWLMPVAVALSTLGSANGMFFCGGRVCCVAAREGHTLSILSMAHVHRLTPAPALMFTALLSLLMVAWGDFGTIVNYFSFTSWFFYGITVSSLLYLRYVRPDSPRPYKVPLAAPVLVVITAACLVLAPILEEPHIEYLYVVAFIFSGLLFYVPFVHLGVRYAGMSRITTHLQLLLQVAPLEVNRD